MITKESNKADSKKGQEINSWSAVSRTIKSLDCQLLFLKEKSQGNQLASTWGFASNVACNMEADEWAE